MSHFSTKSLGFIMKDKNEKDHSLQDLLISQLSKGANPSLRFLSSNLFKIDLAQQINKLLKKEVNLNKIINIINILICDYDYRYVADYLYAINKNKKEILYLFENLTQTSNPTEMNKIRYKLAYAFFLDKIGYPSRGEILQVSNIEEIFVESGKEIAIYFSNSYMKSSLLDLLKDVGMDLHVFIEHQYDLPSINALVRQGVVKIWSLPDGQVVVSKRSNPAKPGKFNKEQLNYEEILVKVGGKPKIWLGESSNGLNIWISVTQPFAVIRDGYSNSYYALSRYVNGESLEMLLMKESNKEIRECYLAHYRLLIDALFDKGILWGDMSPRNIIVEITQNDINYHILDFEKTEIMKGSITAKKRREYCRGQICVEELGIVCTLEEIKTCFHGYFNPENWDYDSKEALSFPERPEVADILARREIYNVSLGSYNKLDREVMNVRLPDSNPKTKERRFPGHINFKVEHYLSCAGYHAAKDYDCKTTEVLIAAKHHRLFDDVVTLLIDIVERIECAFVNQEFQYILNGKMSWFVSPPQQPINKLINIIDSLYNARNDVDTFKQVYIQKTF